MSEHDHLAAPAHDEDDIGPGLATPGVNPKAAIGSYALGLVLSALLTAASFYAVRTHLIWGPAIPAALIVLAIAQIGIHLVFFLHMTTAPDNTNNVLALAFGILIVALIVGGSLWIMAHLDHNMLPMSEVLKRQR
ncbi:cytochrome o ubiquinol oxidase subunit IV [Ramlibacter ginsenosidimutans]|uniref:Cytochrome bo(3) ubiquinol oxidase subunit 4 n=1 Tax=Ramlibacter ginsenosidimutans TaxID=502333 RepID=A0A934TUL3_9BURK|nr:cytochrome o ubiquinol oxidase subunit IV [Ramlibacter ginsenosidimutans]MBK6007336.1 cytochrome o ubiquinol oxidase subunit IV [Ramlibacter ginsenosidimutans]